MVVPLVFVIVLLIEGLTRPGHNSWRDMGSSLSTAPGGWMQTVNFVARGLLIMVLAAATARSHPADHGSHRSAISDEFPAVPPS